MATTMSLGDFYQWVRDNHKRIADIYRETEEIQTRFNDLFTQQRKERDAMILERVPQLSMDAEADLPASLRSLLEERVEVERLALQNKMAQIEQGIVEKQQKADGLIEGARTQVDQLRAQNPILNSQEEELKARAKGLETELQQIEQDLSRLGCFPLGWLLHFFKRRKLQQNRRHITDNLASIQRGIATVRETWRSQKQELQQAQSNLKGQWQALTVEISQLQSQLDYLNAHVDELSQSNAAHSLLDSLTEMPADLGPWRARLEPMIEANLSQTQYETGLKSVAELLGLLRGLGEGMERFARSVATVYEEQRRYKLPELSVSVPSSVITFHSVWPEFQRQVKDEKYLGAHPAEFEVRVREFLPRKVSEKTIQQMFDDLGKSLTQATQAWH